MRIVLPAVVFVVATASLFPRSAAAEPLVVRTFDHTGVQAGQMSTAQAAASSILEEAKLTLEWRDCSSECADAPGPREILLRIVHAPQSAPPGTLGYSIVDVQAGGGRLATVYVDRIRSAASRTRLDPGILLGRAVAHEIGHLLLGTSQHSESGLMRALWSDRELLRDFSGDWLLTPDVATQLARSRAAGR